MPGFCALVLHAENQRGFARGGTALVNCLAAGQDSQCGSDAATGGYCDTPQRAMNGLSCRSSGVSVHSVVGLYQGFA